MAHSRRLGRRQRDVAVFRDGLIRLLGVLNPSGGSFGGFPSWAPQPGREAEAATIAAEVDALSGRAAIALGYDFFIEWKPRGTMQTQPVNPASAWRTIFNHDPMFPPEMILAVCNQAIGALDGLAADAEENEHSFSGKLGRVTGFWGSIRGDRSRGQPSQYGAVILGAVLAVPAALAAA
jgi:hypothetical protein